MKWTRRLAKHTIEGLFTLSGGVTSLVVFLIIAFLFREGFGLFRSPAVERGYGLCVHAENAVPTLDAGQVKRIFDGEITDWKEVGGRPGAIVPFRVDDLFTGGGAMDDDPASVIPRVEALIARTPGIIAFLHADYLPGTKIARHLSLGNITPSDFFTGREWQPAASPSPRFGALPLILGTLLVSLAAILLALPLGIGAAIYLSELAGARMRAWMKPTIELLAGIPSVVYGFFGLVVLAPLIQKTFDLPVGESALTGSLVLAIMALPTIITLAEDATRGVPRAQREASLALGATRWQTICRVVLPGASSGIAAATVLGIGRAVGETMAVLMVTGNAAVLPRSLLEPVRTIPATIAAELGEAPAGGAHYRALFLLGCILFAVTMAINLTAELMTARSRPKNI
ncbi:MAG: phosphate ABC transporter permease subunit PstC [Odoribacteraceae bacterium]|jgi:phosphate transport system permease protein|nr:phosphate ABC transporter permease subunit PstC [Odoribacteraceae bacterium]